MFDEEKRPKKPIRWAMVGGGRGSEIGYAHRSAATRDGAFQLVAGAFDIDPERGSEFGANLGVDPARCYRTYQALFDQESKLQEGIQAVSVATPNNTHYAICKAALESGLHVICEKPVTFSVTEAQALKRIAQHRGRILGVMYGYSGYPMIHQAREMIRRGDIGEIRVVNMQFAHGFNSADDSVPGQKMWRANPEVSGPSYILADVGTHAFHLSQVLTGLELDELLCSRQSFVGSRAPLEDNAHLLLHYKSGAVGTLWASAVNAGSMHQQKIRVVGSSASLEWWDEYPNQLRYDVQGEPARILERGMDYLYLDNSAVGNHRIGGGHPEGFFDSWANLYTRFAVAMDAADRSDQTTLSGLWYPDIDAGIDGVRLVQASVESSDNGSAWVKF